MSNLGGFVNIPYCPGWLINQSGHIWTNKHQRMMKPHCNGTGYKQVVYHNKGYRKKHYVHRLVADIFLGGIPEGLTVNHINGDKLDNSVKNLEIVSSKENNRHAVETGLRTKWRGSKHPQSKLNEEQVQEIFSLLEKEKTNREISDIYQVKPDTINSIRVGKTWGWLKGCES